MRWGVLFVLMGCGGLVEVEGIADTAPGDDAGALFDQMSAVGAAGGYGTEVIEKPEAEEGLRGRIAVRARGGVSEVDDFGVLAGAGVQEDPADPGFEGADAGTGVEGFGGAADAGVHTPLADGALYHLITEELRVRGPWDSIAIGEARNQSDEDSDVDWWSIELTLRNGEEDHGTVMVLDRSKFQWEIAEGDSMKAGLMWNPSFELTAEEVAGFRVDVRVTWLPDGEPVVLERTCAHLPGQRVTCRVDQFELTIAAPLI